MSKIGNSCIFLIILLFYSGTSLAQTEIGDNRHKADSLGVIPGVENFLANHLSLALGKKAGLLTHPAGVNRALRSTADILKANPDINLTTLFGPEHGNRGAIYAGEHVGDETDPHSNLPVYSLYGNHRKPTAKMLANVDIIFVDLQDIGIRGYTYIYTMAKVMEAAAQFGKEVIVFDRPNPIGGIYVEGNLVQDGFYSFVGLYPIPYRHGMTIGELALLFNSEYNIGCKLTIIPMLNWQRKMLWTDTGLSWVPTSPHIPHWESVLFMGATGTFGELRILSEGVGYTSPFEIVGAPWIDGYKFAAALNELKLSGVTFRPLYYKPYYASYSGEICQGVQLHLTDLHSFNSYETGLHIMQTVMRLYPGHNLFALEDRTKMFNKIVGCSRIKTDLENNVPVKEISVGWQRELNDFLKVRAKYLQYE